MKNTRDSSQSTVINERRRKGKEAPTGKGRTDDKRSTSLEARPATRAQIPCLFGATCQNLSCTYRHFPVCLNYKSEKSCIHGSNCQYRHADGEEKPSKKSKSVSNQGAIAILKEKKIQGCLSQNSDPKKSFLRNTVQTRLNASAGHAIKFSGRTWCEIQIRERKGPSRGVFQKGEPHERNPCALKFEERTPQETLRQEECARKAAWDLAKHKYKLKTEDKATFYFLVEIKAPVPVSKNTEERVFVVDSSFNAHAEQEGFKLR